MAHPAPTQGLVDADHADVDRGLGGGQRIIGGQLVALRIEQREEIGRAFAVVDLCQRFGTPRRLCLPAMSASRAYCLA